MSDSMQTFQVVRAQKHQFDSLGDLCIGDNIKKYVAGAFDLTKMADDMDAQKTHFIPLGFVHANPWKALAKLGVENIDDFRVSISYECPYTDRIYQAFCPQGIVTEPGGEEKYRTAFKKARREFWLDCVASPLDTNEYRERPDGSGWESALTRIEQATMGPGYTEMCLASDGYAQLEPVSVALSNGDILVGFVWGWYNK